MLPTCLLGYLILLHCDPKSSKVSLNPSGFFFFFFLIKVFSESVGMCVAIFFWFVCICTLGDF